MQASNACTADSIQSAMRGRQFRYVFALAETIAILDTGRAGRVAWSGAALA